MTPTPRKGNPDPRLKLNLHPEAAETELRGHVLRPRQGRGLRQIGEPLGYVPPSGASQPTPSDRKGYLRPVHARVGRHALLPHCRPNTGDKLRSSNTLRLRQLHPLVGRPSHSRTIPAPSERRQPSSWSDATVALP